MLHQKVILRTKIARENFNYVFLIRLCYSFANLFFLYPSKHTYNLLFMNIFRIQIGSPIIFYAGLILYANHILCKPLINSTSNDPCYRQVYLCMKIALNIHLTWCAELYIRAIVELEWVNVSENLHDKTGWLHSERFSLILSKNIWNLLIVRFIHLAYLLGINRV